MTEKYDRRDRSPKAVVIPSSNDDDDDVLILNNTTKNTNLFSKAIPARAFSTAYITRNTDHEDHFSLIIQ